LNANGKNNKFLSRLFENFEEKCTLTSSLYFNIILQKEKKKSLTHMKRKSSINIELDSNLKNLDPIFCLSVKISIGSHLIPMKRKLDPNFTGQICEILT
jgi:hypothetical protein